MPKRCKSKVSRKAERQDARPFAHDKDHPERSRWAKKCRGKLIYLGKVIDDPTGDQAWLKWLDIRDDLRAGRTPRQKVEGLTVRDLINHWLTSKHRKLESGELTLTAMKSYKQLTDIALPCLGADRLADDLTFEDFAKLRSMLARRYGPSRLRLAIVTTLGIFKFGLENRLLAHAAEYGTEFALPSAKMIRAARNGCGPKMFTAEQLRSILQVTDPTTKVWLFC